MWETPTPEKLSMLIMQGLSKAEIAGYYGCKLKMVEAYLDEFNLIANIERISRKPVFMGETGNTVEKNFSPEKKYRKKYCLK